MNDGHSNVSYVNTFLTGKIRLSAIFGDESHSYFKYSKKIKHYFNGRKNNITISLCGDNILL